MYSRKRSPKLKTPCWEMESNDVLRFADKLNRLHGANIVLSTNQQNVCEQIHDFLGINAYGTGVPEEQLEVIKDNISEQLLQLVAEGFQERRFNRTAIAALKSLGASISRADPRNVAHIQQLYGPIPNFILDNPENANDDYEDDEDEDDDY